MNTDKKMVEADDLAWRRQVAEVEYKTLRAEIISSIDIIMKILIGAHAAVAILYAYILSNPIGSVFVFLAPLLIIIPAYWITIAMLHIMARISSYIIVYLNNYSWEERQSNLDKKMPKCGTGLF